MLIAILTAAVASLAIAGRKTVFACMQPFGLGAEEMPECLKKRLQAE